MISRWFWIAVIALWGVGIMLYSIGYDRGLPILESIDERRNLNEVLILRGQSDAALWKPGYPPGILALNSAAQIITEWHTGELASVVPCASIRTARLLNLLLNAITPLALAFTAYGLLPARAGKATALLVMALWLLTPAVIDQTQYVFPQTVEVLTYTLSLGLAGYALQTRRSTPAIAAVVTGLIAVLFKYTAFPVLGLGVGATLWNWRYNPRRWSITLGLQIALIVVCAVWLFAGYNALALVEAGHTEATNLVEEGGWRNALNPALLMHHSNVLAGMIGMPLIVLIGLLAFGLWYVWSGGTTAQSLTVFSALGMIAVHLITLAAISEPLWDTRRQTLTTIPYVHLLLAVSLVGFARWLNDHRKFYGTVIVTLGIIVWLGAQAITTVRYVLERRLPVTYAAFVEYAGTTLPNGGDEWLLVSDLRPFLPDWTCYSGATHPAVIDAYPLSRSLVDWRDDAFSFVQLHDEYLTQMRSEQAGTDFLDDLTLIAEFPPAGDESQWRTWRRGQPEKIWVYHTYPIEKPLDVRVGDALRLVGWREEQRDGDRLWLWLYWEATAPISTDYDTFVHLTPRHEPAAVLAQGDAPPSANPNRPTSTWGKAGEHLYVGSYRVSLPENADLTAYQLVVGLYDPISGERLLMDTGERALVLPLGE